MSTYNKRHDAFILGSDRDQLIAYLNYAVDDVAGLSPSSAALLVAAIDDLKQSNAAQGLGNDLRKPS